MCGIIGIFGNKEARSLVKNGLEIIKYRGNDDEGFFFLEDSGVGHCLHAIVSKVKQPFLGKGVLVANCEIYNWEELMLKYSIKARNDAELLFKLLELKGLDCLNELEGDYAFAYWRDNKVILCRDIVGVKPVWYSFDNGFSFSSEKKALVGGENIYELNPRIVLEYDLKTKQVREVKRDYFEIVSIEDEYKTIKVKTLDLLEKAIVKRFPEQRFAILFSGGLDSTLLAYFAKKHKRDFVCYVAGVSEDAEDVVYAKKVARMLGVELKIVLLAKEKIEGYLRKVVPLIEDNNVVKVGVGLTLFVALEEVSKDGIKVAFTGQGCEEVFGGYERHLKSLDVNKECLAGLRKIYERDLYRDDVVSMYNSVEVRVPFLDVELINYCLSIPSCFKVKNGFGKVVLRDIALGLGISREIAYRKRRAAQYGSLFDKMIGKLAGKKTKSEYLKGFYSSWNLPIGVLFSSGKDSMYAAYIMKNQNYLLSCLITIKSRNKDSYLYHTPNVHVAELQSKAMGIPLIMVESQGIEEEELEDLRKALMIAKSKYMIKGIVTGALFSTYQRDRIEKIADELGLKVFAPLWHKDQEIEMRELLDKGFSFIFSSVACDGLDKTWLGREISLMDVEKLVYLNERYGVNVAGEGGEFESLVLGCPLFNEKIVVDDADIVMDTMYSGRFIVRKARLVNKKRKK